MTIITICVKDLIGNSEYINIDENSTVTDLKKLLNTMKIGACLNDEISVLENMHIVFNLQNLNDNHSLVACNLYSYCVVTLVKRLVN